MPGWHHCKAIIQSFSLPLLHGTSRGQTLFLHTSVSCSRSFSVLRSPRPLWGSIGFLGWTPKTTSFTLWGNPHQSKFCVDK